MGKLRTVFGQVFFFIQCKENSNSLMSRNMEKISFYCATIATVNMVFKLYHILIEYFPLTLNGKK